MSIPKQDERTPGRWDLFDDRSIGCGCSIRHDNGRHWITVARGLSYEDAVLIVKAVNAYTSTEALREALALYEQAVVHAEAVLGGEYADFDGPFYDIVCKARDAARAALSGSPAPSTDWRSMDTARKNGRPVLGLFKHTFAPPCGDHAVEQWGGTQIVMRHPGLADDGYDCGWNLINGGCGGFPDEWFEGWMPLPPAPDASRTALAGVTAPVEEQ